MTRFRILIWFSILTLGSSDLGGHPAWGIGVDAQNRIYFADLFHFGQGSVWEFIPGQSLTPIYKDFHAHNVQVLTDGSLFTAHGESPYFGIRRSPSGKVDTLIRSPDYARFFGGNCSIAPDGRIYFAVDRAVWEARQDQPPRKVSKDALTWNNTIYTAPDGYIYIPDIDEGNGRLIRIDPQSGQSTLLADSLITLRPEGWDRSQDILLGMTQGPDQAIYIAEWAGQRIIRVGPDGVVSTYYRSSSGWAPTGIAFDNEIALILEAGTGLQKGPRILSRNPSGQIEVLLEDPLSWKAPTPVPEHNNPSDQPRYLFWLIGFSGLILLLYILFRRR